MQIKDYIIVLEQQESLDRDKKLYLNIKNLPGKFDKFTKENIDTALSNLQKFQFNAIKNFTFLDRNVKKQITGPQLQMFLNQTWTQKPDTGLDIFSVWSGITSGSFYTQGASTNQVRQKIQVKDNPTKDLITSFQNWITTSITNKENSPILYIDEKEWDYIKKGKAFGRVSRNIAGTLYGIGKAF